MTLMCFFKAAVELLSFHVSGYSVMFGYCKQGSVRTGQGLQVPKQEQQGAIRAWKERILDILKTEKGKPCISAFIIQTCCKAYVPDAENLVVIGQRVALLCPNLIIHFSTAISVYPSLFAYPAS